MACARDDAATHRMVVPDGVWACGGCGAVVLAGAPSAHLCTDHPVF